MRLRVRRMVYSLGSMIVLVMAIGAGWKNWD